MTITKENLKSKILKVARHIPVLKVFAKRIYTYRKAVRSLIQERESLKSKVNSLTLEMDNLKQKNLADNQYKDDVFNDLLKAYFNKVNETEFIPLITKFKPDQKIKKLKSILQINTLDNVGGAAKVAYRIHRQLTKEKFDSKMLVAHKSLDDIDINVLPLVHSKEQQYLNLYSGPNDYDDLFNISGFNIKTHSVFLEADIVHLHNTYGKYFSLFDLPKLTSIKPFVKTLHDMIFILGKWDRYLEIGDYEASGKEFPYIYTDYEGLEDKEKEILILKEKIYQNSDMLIVSPSKWLKRYLDKSILKDKDIRVVHNGIDHNIYKNWDKLEARKKLGLPADKMILLFQAHNGKNNIWKGGQYLEEAYNNLKDKNKNILFLNVGGESEGKRKFWQDIPYIQDEAKMALYYSASDLFVYPSIADIFPLTVLEALSCGTPVIAFRTGGIPEAVDHMENGYIANYKDVGDFVKGIELFLEDSELTDKANKKAREKIEKNFTIDIMTNQYIKLYEEAISNFNKRL